MAVIFDTRPKGGQVTQATININRNDPTMNVADMAGFMLSVAEAVNELQEIVATLSATPVSSDPIIV